MNFDDLVSLGTDLESYEIYFKTLCDYGIVLEDMKDASDGGLLGDIKFHIKFSLPEFWGYTLPDSDTPITKNLVISLFKNSFNALMVSMWKPSYDDWDEDMEEACLSCMKYFCRIRKGETYAFEDKVKATSNMKCQMEMIREILERRTGFEEV